MLDAEADRLCGAGRYKRSEGRKDTRAGSYERSLDTKAGPVKLRTSINAILRSAFLAIRTTGCSDRPIVRPLRVLLLPFPLPVRPM
jgi:hypothetical protein